MAKLTEEQQRFIVERLACYDTPTQVADAVKEQFGVTITRQQAECYDAERPGRKPSAKWCDIYAATRKRFLESAGEIPIAQKAVRLRWLNALAVRAITKGNSVEARAAMRQAAEDVGGAYTNTRNLAHSGEVKGGVLAVPGAVSATDWSVAAKTQQAGLATQAQDAAAAALAKPAPAPAPPPATP